MFNPKLALVSAACVLALSVFLSLGALNVAISSMPSEQTIWTAIRSIAIPASPQTTNQLSPSTQKAKSEQLAAPSSIFFLGLGFVLLGLLLKQKK